MAYFIDPFTVYAGLRQEGLKEDAAAFKALIEEALQGASRKLADKAGFAIGEAALEEPDFGGLLIAARPLSEGDPIPECIRGADTASEWCFED
jgi:hypothetical protein